MLISLWLKHVKKGTDYVIVSLQNDTNQLIPALQSDLMDLIPMD
jgi:hypothetical protein